VEEKCKHIYEYVNADFEAMNAYNKQWLKDNPEAWRSVGWWSI
jgi:hypothetical protein